MQNDLEIAEQLELLSKKISEGITGANKVLEQVREVELDVSSAEKAKAEIAEVIEVEISRAKSEFEVEISRAISEFELEISPAISEVQPEISRAETAKAEIAEVIEVEISRVEKAKSEAQTQLEQIRELTEQNESTYNKFSQEKLKLKKLHTSFESLIKEIGGSAGLEKLRGELQKGREVAFKEIYDQQEKLEKRVKQQEQLTENLKKLGRELQEGRKVAFKEIDDQQEKLEKMEKQQKKLIQLGGVAILIVSVWVLIVSVWVFLIYFTN